MSEPFSLYYLITLTCEGRNDGLLTNDMHTTCSRKGFFSESKKYARAKETQLSVNALTISYFRERRRDEIHKSGNNTEQ